MENLNGVEIGFALGMFALGFIAGTVVSYNRVSRFIARIQEQLKAHGDYQIRVSPWYTLRVMLFGIPKKKS